MESKMFWGLVFIGIGMIMLANYVLGIHLPIARILVSLFVIYIGVHMLFGSMGVKIHRQATDEAAIFSSSTFQWINDMAADDKAAERQYKTIFGDGQLDLTNVDVTKQDVSFNVKTVFGETRIFVKKGTPLRVRSKTVFGSTELPGQNQAALGKFNYHSDGLKDGQPALDIESDVAFGSLRIIER